LTLHEGVDEMRRAMANTMFFLCHGGLQEVRKAKHPKAKLTDDEIDFYE
jgi:hypothetical protein